MKMRLQTITSTTRLSIDLRLNFKINKRIVIKRNKKLSMMTILFIFLFVLQREVTRIGAIKVSWRRKKENMFNLQMYNHLHITKLLLIQLRMMSE